MPEDTGARSFERVARLQLARRAISPRRETQKGDRILTDLSGSPEKYLVKVVRKKHKMDNKYVVAKKSELKSAILETNQLWIMVKAVSSTQVDRRDFWSKVHSELGVMNDTRGFLKCIFNVYMYK